MIVLSQPVELTLPPPSVPRSPGIHQSGIIRSIAMQSGILTPDWEEDQSLVERSNEEWWAKLPEDAKVRICIGLAWEEWYIRTQLPEVIDHPGELCVDGVYMNMDGSELSRLILDGRPQYRQKVHEIKTTSKSLNTLGQNDHENRQDRVEGARYFKKPERTFQLQPLLSQWMYLAQGKGYCKGLGTNLLDLHVLFLYGDYSYPMRPQAYRYQIEFDQAEIDTNWELLIDWRDYRMGLRV